MPKVHIVKIENNTNVGDNNVAQAIINELKDNYKNNDVITSVLNIGTKENLIDTKKYLTTFKTEPETDYVFIGAGDLSVDPLVEAKKAIPEAVTVYASHQSRPNLKEAQEYLDKIALPAVDTFKTKTPSKLISTLGVASLITKEDVIKIYNDKKDNIIQSDNGYIMAVMGGDATNPAEDVQHYTPKEAIKLADHLTKMFIKSNGKKLLITNGPRTGKHISGTKEVTQNHRGDTPLDPCSQALVDRLEKNGLCPDVDFQFSDFRYLEKGVDSAYMSFLGAAATSSESEVLIAGESTSMLTDCNQVGISSLTSFNNAAMNPNHTNLNVMFNNNSMSRYLDADFKLITPTNKFKTEGFDIGLTTSKQIAKEITKLIKDQNTINNQVAKEITELLNPSMTTNKNAFQPN